MVGGWVGEVGAPLPGPLPHSPTLLCRLREWQESPSLIHMPLKVLLAISHSCQMLGRMRTQRWGGWGAPLHGACSDMLVSVPSSPEDPAVGVPAEGLLVLRHVVEWAELVLVPGGTAAVRGVPAPSPATPPLTHVDSTRLKHLPESLKRCTGPGRGACNTLSPGEEQACRPGKNPQRPTKQAAQEKGWFKL